MKLGKVTCLKTGSLENGVLTVKAVIEVRGVIEVVKSPLVALDLMGWLPGKTVAIKKPTAGTVSYK